MWFIFRGKNLHKIYSSAIVNIHSFTHLKYWWNSWFSSWNLSAGSNLKFTALKIVYSRDSFRNSCGFFFINFHINPYRNTFENFSKKILRILPKYLPTMQSEIFVMYCVTNSFSTRNCIRMDSSRNFALFEKKNVDCLRNSSLSTSRDFSRQFLKYLKRFFLGIVLKTPPTISLEILPMVFQKIFWKFHQKLAYWHVTWLLLKFRP